MKELSSIHRREFHRVGLASLLAVLRPRCSAESPSSYWKLGIITDEVSNDLGTVLSKFYPKYSLRWAEIRHVKSNGHVQYIYNSATPAQAREIKKQLDDANVKVSVLDSAIFKIPLPGTKPVADDASDLNPAQGEYNRQLDDLKRAAEVAHELGTDRVRIFTFRRVQDPSSIFDRVVENLHRALTVANEQQLVLLVENEYDCNVATSSEIVKLFRAIPDRQLMHNWDPGNCYESGETPFPDAWDRLDHSRILHMHLKDAVNHAWKPIGAGKIDFVGQFRALKQMNYSGTMSLETHYSNSQHDPYTSSVESMDGLFAVLGKV
jgi:L-ribulose-5-phosphate 3-epimerase